MSIYRNRRQTHENSLVLDTQTSRIHSSTAEKLLGGVIHQNLKWGEHILYGDTSLLRSLSSRINALKLISYVASFKTRKMVAEGIFMSKLIYLIEVWGGCEAFLLKSVQILQNKAARIVTRRDRRTPVCELLLECGWLSVKQLVFYHSVLMLHKTRVSTLPKYLYNMYIFNQETEKSTRLGALKLIKSSKSVNPKTQLTRNGFKFRSIQYYNQLPLEIRCVEKVTHFKKLLKLWIRENVQIN